MGSAGRDALTKCGEIIKRARTYRARADVCGAGTGRVATTGRTPCDHESAPRDDGYAARDDGSAVPDDGSAARDDGWQRATTSRQLATTGAQRATMGTGVLKKMGDDGYAMPDDGYRVGRQRVLLGR